MLTGQIGSDSVVPEAEEGCNEVEHGAGIGDAVVDDRDPKAKWSGWRGELSLHLAVSVTMCCPSRNSKGAKPFVVLRLS